MCLTASTITIIILLRNGMILSSRGLQSTGRERRVTQTHNIKQKKDQSQVLFIYLTTLKVYSLPGAAGYFGGQDGEFLSSQLPVYQGAHYVGQMSYSRTQTLCSTSYGTACIWTGRNGQRNTYDRNMGSLIVKVHLRGQYSVRIEAVGIANAGLVCSQVCWFSCSGWTTSILTFYLF